MNEHEIVVDTRKPMPHRIAALDLIQTDCKNNATSVDCYTRKWNPPKGPGRYAAIRKLRGDARNMF